MDNTFGRGLGNLPMLVDVETRSMSAENPDGAKGGGAKADPGGEGAARELGRGWKVRPCITLPAQSTTSLAEIDGPGVIQHIWMTVDSVAYRDCIWATSSATATACAAISIHCRWQ